MKRKMFLTALVLLICGPAFNAQAQWGKGCGMRGFNQGSWNAPPWINLTQDQLSSLGNLRQEFSKATASLMTEIEKKRLTMSGMLLDAEPDAKKVTTLQREISGLEAQYDEQLVTYQLKARTILTQEQVAQLPPGCTMGFGNMLCGAAGPGYGCGSGGRHGGGWGPGCGRGCW